MFKARSLLKRVDQPAWTPSPSRESTQTNSTPLCSRSKVKSNCFGAGAGGLAREKPGKENRERAMPMQGRVQSPLASPRRKGLSQRLSQRTAQQPAVCDEAPPAVPAEVVLLSSGGVATSMSASSWVSGRWTAWMGS